MVDAAQEAIGFAKNRQRVDLNTDRMLSLALVKDIEIIGEAAVRLSDETREQYAAIPWASIIGMRNRLIHAYFDIDNDRVWDTIHDDLPSLVSELESIVKSVKDQG